MSCGGGSGTNTVTQNSAPPANVQQAYSNLTNAAFTQAQQPLQQYNNQLIAGFTPQQTQAFQEIQNSQGMATPYINAAAQEFGQATTPFYQSEPAYQSPYTGQVTNALQGLFNENNAEQQAQTNSNSTAQGAFGGDRSAVANALTAKQQNLSEAPTLANVLQGGYQTALGAAEAQGWLGEQGGFGLGSLGTEAQNSALTGANAELSAGGLQQQLGQEMLNVPYEQFQSAQAYPWQVLGQLSPIVSGVGSLSGGTGSTTYPGPSLVSQLGGLGIAGLGTYGLLNSTGAASGLADLFGTGAGIGAPLEAGAEGAFGGGAIGDILGGAALAAKSGGRIGFADGGGIGGGASTSAALPTVPSVNLDYLVHPGPLSKGSGPPHAPQGNPEQFQGQSPMQELQMFNGLDKMVGEAGIGAGSAFGGRLHRQDGGDSGDSSQSGLGAAETTGAPLAGLPPNAQGFVQKMQTLPMDQLQAIAARTPPSSPYGQMIQRVLTSRRMTPTAAPNQVSSASGVPIGTGIGQVPGIGGQGQGQGQQQQQQQSGTQQGQGYAVGGGPVIQEEPDMDPHPVVDHSGDTVVVRYPSEGKTLDLGIPSSKSQRRTLAAGGAGGTVAPGPPTVLGSGASSAQPFFSSETAPNGIAIPQLSMDAFAAPGGPNSMTANQGGIGNWFNPIPNLGTTGATAPTTIPLSPALLQDFAPIPGPSGMGVADGGRTRLQGGGEDDAVPGVEIAPDSPFASGNGFGSPDLGPAAAVVTPAGGVVTPSPAPATTPASTAAASATPPKPAGEVAQEVKREPAATPQTGQTGQTPPTAFDPARPLADIVSGGGLNPFVDHVIKNEGGSLPGVANNPGNIKFAGLPGQVDSGVRATDGGTFASYQSPEEGRSAIGQLVVNAARGASGRYGSAPTVGSFMTTYTGGGGSPDRIVGGHGGIGSQDNMPSSTGYMQRIPDGGAGIGEPYGGIGGAGVTLPPPRTAPSAEWSQSPWMIPIAIGAGMMSGRSSHPLVNVGQGLTEGVKTAETQGEQGTRAAAYENEAANRTATLAQTGQYQRGELNARQNEFDRQTKAEQDRFQIEITNAKTTQARADAMDRHYENMDAINAGYKQMMMSKPLPGFEKDQNGNIVYGTHQFNPDTGHFEFKPGAGEGRGPTTGNNTFAAKQQAWLAVHPGDAQGALDFAGGQKQMTPEEVNRSAANLAQKQMASDPTAMALNPEEQQQRLGQYERFWVGQIQGSGGATGQRPTASAAPPGGGPAAPAWTQEHPLVPRTQADIDNAPPGSVIQTPHGMMVKPQPQVTP